MRDTTDFSRITVFGARGHTGLLLRGLEEYWQGSVRVTALIDDVENGFVHPDLAVPVISSADRRRDYGDLPVLLTVGSGDLRARMAAQYANEGAVLATAVCRNQRHVNPDVVFGAGSLCAPFTRIGVNVRVGAAVQLLSSVIAHDVVIGDNVTLGYESTVLGHVEIGDNVAIAPRAVISSGTRKRPLRIGAGAVVGTGAVVLRDVAAGERVIGNPAVPIRDWVRSRRA